MPVLEILVVVFLTMLNGLLAMSELAIASSRPARLKFLADQGVNGANRAIKLASDPGRFLSTVQIGITLIGIIAGAVSGATLGERFASTLASWGVPKNFADPIGFGAVIAFITYLSLIIGELVPKQIALRNPERIACLVAPAMTLLAKISAPIVWFLERSGRMILFILGQSKVKDDTLTDAEIHAMIAEAESSGVIEPEERKMIAGVMRLGDRMVRTVMTPRTEVQMLDVDETFAKVGKQLAETGYSRFVAYQGSQDNIIGVIETKDVAAAMLRRKSIKLKQLVKEAPIVYDRQDAVEIIDKLKASDVKLAFVYDEHGHFEGIVTPTDVLESIVGAFETDHDDEPEAIERDDGSILFAGWTPIDSVASRLNMILPEKRDYQTLAGFALDRLGHLPKTGESFEERGYRFEIVDMDGRKIDRVIVSRRQTGARRVRLQ
jgi:putative hemolysin